MIKLISIRIEALAGVAEAGQDAVLASHISLILKESLCLAATKVPRVCKFIWALAYPDSADAQDSPTIKPLGPSFFDQLIKAPSCRVVGSLGVVCARCVEEDTTCATYFASSLNTRYMAQKLLQRTIDRPMEAKQFSGRRGAAVPVSEATISRNTTKASNFSVLRMTSSLRSLSVACWTRYLLIWERFHALHRIRSKRALAT